MSISEFMASQFRKPRGFVGKVFMSRILNRVNAEMNNLTLSSLGIKDSDRILEVGFGGGALLNGMAVSNSRVSLYGVDFSLDMVRFCQSKMHNLILEGRLQLNCANVESLPFETGTFTKICTVNTIYFWEDCAVAIRELRRVLKQNGLLVITFGDEASMSKQAVTKHGFTLYTSADVQHFMEVEGLSDIHAKKGRDNSGKFYSLIGRN